MGTKPGLVLTRLTSHTHVDTCCDIIVLLSFIYLKILRLYCYQFTEVLFVNHNDCYIDTYYGVISKRAPRCALGTMPTAGQTASLIRLQQFAFGN